MTIRARQTLSDCEYALTDFEKAANTVFQSSRWVAVITLLRTVGFVLKDVDRPAADKETQRLINAAWDELNATKPEPRIFHDFINAERYQVVHLYEVRASVNVTVRPGPGSFGGAVFGAPGSGPTTFDFFKLIMWHGWADHSTPPQGSLDYYQRVQERMGSGETARFARLFLAPGAGHCGGGPGRIPDQRLDVLLRWVENGAAPEALGAMNWSPATNQPIRLRSVCQCPLVARYKGRGSTADAANFECRSHF